MELKNKVTKVIGTDRSFLPNIRTFDIWIWLYGNPVFSLSYSKDRYSDISTRGELTDITGYRPDPRDMLNKNKKYKAKGTFSRETDYNGDDLWILRNIIIEPDIPIEKIKMVYIR